MHHDIRESQLQASDPESSVYVSASAGSGKTKVLIDRILRLLLNGSDINHILCVTFTKEAAAEMILRLKARAKLWFFLNFDDLFIDLSNLIARAPNDDELQKAKSLYLHLLHNQKKIRIQTIHSFCNDILQLGATSKDPINIISSGDQQRFLQQAFHHALELLPGETNYLATRYSHHYLFSIISQVVRQHSNFSEYLRRCSSAGNSLPLAIFHSFGINESQLDLHEYTLKLLSGAEFTGICQVAKALANQEQELGNDLLNWLALSIEEKSSTIDLYINYFLTQEYQPRSRIKGLKSLTVSELEVFKRHQNDIFALAQALNAFKAATDSIPIACLSQAVFERYNLLKRAAGFIDYDELLLKTIRELTISERRLSLLWNLDCAIDHILVDEAQDLNQQQWQIINLIADEFFAGLGAKEINRTIFIVGDVKQSIFRFQGAAPEIFQNIRSFYRQKCAQALKQWKEINFHTSFRSGIKILEVVDELFSGQQLEDSYQKHHSYRNSEANVEIWPIVPPHAPDKSGQCWQASEMTPGSQALTLANLICAKIDTWLTAKRSIIGQNRSITPQDIMIIFRKRSAIYQAIANKLREYGIPTTSRGCLKLHEHLVILDIIAAIKFALNHGDNFNLAALLKSPLCNLNEEDVLQLMTQNPQRSVYKKIVASADQSKVQAMLQEIIQKHSLCTDYAFLYWLTAQYVAASPESDRIVAEELCNQFLETFLTFQNIHYLKSMSSFLRWLKASEITVKSWSAKNAVKLITAHSAKGLQAPIVILADASESENLSADTIFWQQGDLFFNSCSKHDVTLARIKEQNKTIQKNDSMKLLYVAMTRAEDELYICGIDKHSHKDSWYNLLSQNLNANQ